MPVIALPAIPAIVEAIKITAIVVAGAVGTAVVVDQVDRANQRSQSRTRTEPAAVPCQGCRNNPCKALAVGAPGRYRGGAHGSTKLPWGDGLDSHHMPANAISPLPANMGPAIQMDPQDHRLTASYGSGPDAVMYRAEQSRLIAAGNFSGAFAMDVADIKANFGDKYDGAIAQAGAYLACLKQHGIVR